MTKASAPEGFEVRISLARKVGTVGVMQTWWNPDLSWQVKPGHYFTARPVGRGTHDLPAPLLAFGAGARAVTIFCGAGEPDHDSLALMHQGAHLVVHGPFGSPLTPPPSPGSVLLLGEGSSCGPLAFVASQYWEQSPTTSVRVALKGDQSLELLREELDPFCREAWLATEFNRAWLEGVDYVAACGSPAFRREVVFFLSQTAKRPPCQFLVLDGGKVTLEN